MNATFLHSSLAPLKKGVHYVLEKGKAYVAPLSSGDEIRLEIVLVDLNSDSKSECTKITQDINDTKEAQIVFY